MTVCTYIPRHSSTLVATLRVSLFISVYFIPYAAFLLAPRSRPRPGVRLAILTATRPSDLGRYQLPQTPAVDTRPYLRLVYVLCIHRPNYTSARTASSS